MSYISPSGNIWLLHNVPIDKTYQNTLYWENNAAGKTAQRTFFIGTSALPSSYVKYTFTNQYYSRHTKGSIRVQVLADNVLDCNYLVFQNSSFGAGKYFYAFITSVEYINNSVTQINFELDVIQTWYFDFELEPCFVERMHTATDAKYSNLVPEPLEPGEYIYQNIARELTTKDLVVIIAVVEVVDGKSQGKRYGKIYGGCSLYAAPVGDTAAVNNKISEYIASPDSVVSIYLAPLCLLSDDIEFEAAVATPLTVDDVKTGLETLVFSYPDPEEANMEKFGNYTPHNNKLYSYPFTMLEVFTPEGAKADYRYEFFNNNGQGKPSFLYGGSITSPVELVLVPDGYKIGRSASPVQNLIAESVTLRDYPLCSWNVDAYKAWVAQNAIPLALEAGGSMIGNVVGLLTNPAGAFLNTVQTVGGIAGNIVSTVMGIMSQDYRASIAADQMHGQTKGSANIATDTQGFYFAHKVINEASARMIDSFFDRFGYAIKQITSISRKNRKYFTYIKTVGCTLHGGVPSEDEDLICKLHDNGITYWDSSQTSAIGNFNLAVGNIPDPAT